MSGDSTMVHSPRTFSPPSLGRRRAEGEGALPLRVQRGSRGGSALAPPQTGATTWVGDRATRVCARVAYRLTVTGTLVPR